MKHRFFLSRPLMVLFFLAAALNNSPAVSIDVPFEAADVAFDPVRPYAYISGYANKTLVVANLTTGAIEKEFKFTRAAESIAISPNGNKMYVALLTRPHDYYWWDTDGHVGYIAEFDLAQRTKTKEFQINEDPFDLAVTDSGILIVPSGSGQWTYIRTYNTSTGALLSTGGIRQMCHVTLHPSQAAVYTADTDSSPSDLARYNFDPVTGVFSTGWESIYHGDYPMNGQVWCHPNGTNVLAAGGGIFTSSPNQSEDLRFVRSLNDGNEAVAFDPAHQALFAIHRDLAFWWYPDFVETNYLQWFNLNTYQLASSQGLPQGSKYVGVNGTNVYVATITSGNTHIGSFTNPALGAETNAAPLASFVKTPTNATTLTMISFDASSSTDDQGSASLQYRWDWENDGNFETSFTNQPLATHHFNISGTKTVALQVKDVYGVIKTATQTFDVALEADPGSPSPANPQFEVQFPAADVAFDPIRPYAYVSGYTNKLLAVLNLTNGFIERQFTFDWNPQSITISPDGQKMYVTLIAAPQTSSWYYQEKTNYIAEFDLNQQVKTKEFEYSGEPYDLAVTDNGILVVSDKFDGSQGLRSIRTDTGALIGKWPAYSSGRLSLHPKQDAVYLADTALSPADIRRFNFDAATGVPSTYWDSPYHGDYSMGGKVWCHPNGTNVIVGGGVVFSSSSVRAEDMRYSRSLAGVIDGAEFDTNHVALFTVSASTQYYYYGSATNYLRWYNLQSLEVVSSQLLSNASQYVHAMGSDLYTASTDNNRTLFERFTNPALGAETNQMPVAVFAMSPTNPTTLSTISFDASESTDDQGAGTALQYRWDWENDGTFDIAFTNQPVATHHYNIAGTKTVALQVMDRYGAVSTTTHTFNVLWEDDPGVPGGTNAAFELQFRAADVVFDPIRPYAYVSGYSNRTLAVLNLTNGFVERQFNFDWNPESITLSPDGSKLYVALLTRPHDYYWWDEDGHVGYIAEFDLAQQAKVKELEINEDPFDIAVTDSGILVVTGGSGQWTHVRTYSTATGGLLSTKNIRQMSHLSLHPSQASVYTADTDLGPSEINHYNFDPVSGVFSTSWDSPYHGDYPMSGNVWCEPNGTNVISRGGTVLSSSPQQALDLRYSKSLSGGQFDEAAFDVFHQALFTVGGDSYQYYNDSYFGTNFLRWYNLQTYELVSSQVLSNGTRFVGANGDYLYAARPTGNRTVFQRLVNPSLGAETNQAPVAAFVRAQTDATTLTAISFDASGSTDDQGGGIALQYRWDWDNDGTFETSFSYLSAATHHYNIAGTKTVTLQVKDRYGAIGTTTQTFEVVTESDPGTPGGTNIPFQLPFAAADIVFDPIRPYAYVSGYAEKTLAVYNLTNGLIERQFNFEWNPKSITISPDGQKMYVALITGQHFAVWNQDPTNYIAEFDLNQQVKTKEFELAGEPFDLAVTDNGILLVTDAFDGSTALRSVRTATGERIGKWYCYLRGRISLHPSQQAVYLADTSLSPLDIRRFNFDSTTGVPSSSWDSPYHGDYPLEGDVWCHPNGTNLIVHGGGVFSSSAVQAQDMRYQQSITRPITGLDFDATNQVLLTVGSVVNYYYYYTSTNYLRAYDLNTYRPTSTLIISNDMNYVHALGSYVYLAGVTGNQTIFQRVVNPSVREPVINVDLTDVTALSGSNVALNVSMYGSGPLRYQWYFNNNRVLAATNSFLALPDVQPTDAGEYFVVISNRYGSVTSSIATVTVLTLPPSITRQPNDLTAPVGSIASLTVTATGSAPIRYQWMKNGDPINGATTAVLTMTNLFASDSGLYSVIVSNPYGSIVSSNGVLTVDPRLLFFDDFDPGIDLTQWSAFGGTTIATNFGGRVSGPNALWFGGDGSRFATTRLLSTGEGSISFNLRVSNGGGWPWEQADLPSEGIVLEYSINGGSGWVSIGTYDTYAFNTWTNIQVSIPVGAQTENTLFRWRQLNNSGWEYDHWALDDVQIVASGAPRIISQPKSLRVNVGASATFDTSVTGADPISYQWRKGGSEILDATNWNYTIPQTADADFGVYSVIISNAFGHVTSADALLKINHAPTADASATTLSVIAARGNLGFPVLDATRSSDPDGDALGYQWMRNGLTNVIASGAVSSVTLRVGLNPLTLVADDGLAIGTNSITIEVLTPGQATRRLVSSVSQAVKAKQLYTAMEILRAFEQQVRQQVLPRNRPLAIQLITLARQLETIIAARLKAQIAHGAAIPINARLNIHQPVHGTVDLTFQAPTGRRYQVEASTNLVQWFKVGSPAETAPGRFQFEDRDAAKHPARFYRITTQ